MSWHKVTMSVDQVVNREHSRLQEQFEALFVAAGAPQDMALFSATLAGNTELNIYFSPGSVRHVQAIIDHYGGSSCEKPSEIPALLVGHADARERMFPVKDA